MDLLLASNNPKKLAELSRVLTTAGIGASIGNGVRVVAPADVGGLPDVDEDQPTFRGNAAKKARAAALRTGLWCLADDSGLEVDALDGQPGVHSARWAGRHGDDEANNTLLLERLRDVPEAGRGARFVCALALARPDGELALEVEGATRGRILTERRGDRDFGYDPLFLFTEQGHAETGKGFAELEPSAKARVSHRGRALAELLDRLPDLLATAG